MSDLSCLNIDAVRSFMLSRGGKVTNHELVKHFKGVLTNPATRDEARIKFKEIVNTLATIARDADGGKQLTLRKKYRSPEATGGPPSTPRLELPTELNLQYTPVYHSPTTPDYPELTRRASQDSLFSSLAFRSPLSPGHHGSSQSPLPGSPLSGAYHPLAGTPTGGSSSGGFLSRRESVSSIHSYQQQRQQEPAAAVFGQQDAPPLQRSASQVDFQPPPQRPPSQQDLQPPPVRPLSQQDVQPPPPVPPRRRSSDKIRLDMEEVENKENKENISNEDSKISVKERSQKFDRMASEVALHKPLHHKKRSQEKADRDEEDSVSVFDSKSRTWIVRCAQGDYQTLAKLAAESPKLVRFKDPSNGYTALHWASKHGNADLVKLFAGSYKADVNARTNGGYTPLHIAMQFGHEDVYSILTEVYGADQNMRDWSGKKPRQYQTSKGTTVSADTFRKIKERKKHAEKDLGFLRIGSLNVRVKRTTEAFSNFLGVGSAEKLHKNWGSADNLPQGGDAKKMPPPKYPVKKRKSKRGGDFSARSRREVISEGKSETQPDSDSDAGFGATWQSTV